MNEWIVALHDTAMPGLIRLSVLVVLVEWLTVACGYARHCDDWRESIASACGAGGEADSRL